MLRFQRWKSLKNSSSQFLRKSESYLVPKGDNWYRETIYTKADGQVSELKSDIKIDIKKGVMTILISGKVGNSSLKKQKNVWIRQHK